MPVGEVVEISSILTTGGGFIDDKAQTANPFDTHRRNALPAGRRHHRRERLASIRDRQQPRLRQRAAGRALRRRRRAGEREHRPDRHPGAVPLRARPPARADQGDGPAEPRRRRHLVRHRLGAAGRRPDRPAHADRQHNQWNGERLFQAAKFGTETEYQHIVFDEFARYVAPAIHVAGGVNVHIDPAITSEFANVVYRFGHSMLDENINALRARRRRQAGDRRQRPAADDAGRPDRRPSPTRCSSPATPASIDGRHRARHRQPGQQRDRRVRHRLAAEQPARPAARPRRAEHRPRPRHRRGAAEPGAQPALQPDPATASSSPTPAGSISAAS